MKKRFIACILACALLLMGTGYAYWTDMFTIKGTVNTGDFKVELIEAKKGDAFTDYTGPFNDINPKFSKAEGENPSRIVNNTVSVKVNNMYPGYAHEYTFKAKNKGTVAAVLDSIGVSTQNMTSEKLRDAIGISLKATINNRSWKWVGNFFFGHWEEVTDSDEVVDTADYSFSIKDTGFISLSEIGDSIPADSDIFYLDTANPNEQHDMTIELVVGMDPDAAGELTTGTWKNGYVTANSDDLTELESGDFSLIFHWDQYNASASTPLE